MVETLLRFRLLFFRDIAMGMGIFLDSVLFLCGANRTLSRMESCFLEMGFWNGNELFLTGVSIWYLAYIILHVLSI